MECVGHTQKRLDTRLRNLVKSRKGTANPIYGKNKLTETVIDSMRKYYGIAICNNRNDLYSMKKVSEVFYFCVLK